LAEGLKVTYDMVGARGGVIHLEWGGMFDGRDYPVQGVDYVLTNAYRQIDDNSYEVVIKIDGNVVGIARSEVSGDRTTITTVTASRDSQGKTVSTTAVYERLSQS
jgi:hypothetical protein